MCMRKSNTLLFTLMLVLIMAFLVAINFFKDSQYLIGMDKSAAQIISIALFVLIILLFIYRELENKKIQNDFIAVVAHKFRTPLTGIHWTIDMLQKDMTLLEKKDLLLEMQKANNRLMEIVDLLVDFAKFDKRLIYASEVVSLTDVVATSFSKYSAAIKNKNIKFSVDSTKEVPEIMADKSKIQFVIDMLIDNAVKYTPKDGSVSVTFEADSKTATVKITDSGIGMNFFDSKRIFGYFFRAKNAKLMDTEGLGLGLFTAQNIVERHQGKIWASSPGVNKGSTFFVRLPIKR
jgi:signal transduction histidine kinase